MKKIFVKIAALIVAAIFVLGGCNSKSDQKGDLPHDFPMITPPSMMGQGINAAIYVAKKYWNPFIDSSKVFSQDTAYIGGVSREQFVNAYRQYAQIIQSIPLAEGIKAQSGFVSRLLELERSNPANTIFETAVEFAEEVFYGVNSDFRNEELYLPFAAALSRFEGLDQTSRERYAKEVENCSKNRIGSTAANFSYITGEGKSSTLYSTEAEYTILFFSNPGCTACKDLIGQLEQSLIIEKMFSEGRINVINIYIDEDLTQWYEYMKIYPKHWINCYNGDMEIREGGLYDVRAIPSIYLLDKEKKVILKDAPIHTLINQLHSIG